MNAARRAARAGRNLLVALLLGAVIIVAIVIAYMSGRSSHPSAGPTSAAAASQPASRSTTTDTSDAAPTGCLGGTGRNNAMLLSAQAAAPHTAFGAVDFAAALTRWAYRYPYPTTAQADEISTEVVSPSASAGFKNIAASYAGTNDITDGQVPAKTPFYLSTTTGLWRVVAGSTSDRVTVDLNASYVVDGAVSPTKVAAVSATLVWSDGKWRLLSEQAPDTTALTAGGTAFSAGC